VKAILRKIIIAVVGAAMLAAAAGVMVVAGALALYGVLRPYVGGPGAAAIIVLAAGLLMLGVGLLLESRLLRGGQPKAGPPEDDQDLLTRLMALAMDRPLIAGGALIGAVFLAIRNPALMGVVVKAFLDPKPRPPKRG